MELAGRSIAPLWKRIVAYILDSVILSFFVLSPLTKSNIQRPTLESLFRILDIRFFLVLIIASILILLYWSLLEFRFQQSIGKMIMNIMVRSKTKKLTFSQCLIRNLSKISSILLILDSVSLIRGKTQRYLETIAKTEVIGK